MPEFRVGGWTYRSKPLCAADQWALLRRLQPVLPALKGLDDGMRLGADDVVDVVAMLVPLVSAPEDDMRAVFRTCLSACERRDGETWGSVGETPGLADLMAIVAHVTSENLGPLFAMKRVRFKPVPVDRLSYEPVTMHDGEDWLFRPVLRGLCQAESLWDGTLRIERLAKLNDALDIADENEARARKAAQKK